MTQALQPDNREQLVAIPVDNISIEGNLTVPPDAQGVVLFAHGSGSSRHSPRNQYVARVLQSAGLATLLMDLLTREEEEKDEWAGHLRFNMPFLARRLGAATDWLIQHPDTRTCKVGYFGASMGAGAALVAAAQRTDVVSAIVARGGRPDLAGQAIAAVRAPTLLIVGGRDTPVIRLNQEALARLNTAKQLTIMAGATHLFEEPGALEHVALLARDWFVRHLTPATPRS